MNSSSQEAAIRFLSTVLERESVATHCICPDPGQTVVARDAVLVTVSRLAGALLKNPCDGGVQPDQSPRHTVIRWQLFRRGCDPEVHEARSMEFIRRRRVAVTRQDRGQGRPRSPGGESGCCLYE